MTGTPAFPRRIGDCRSPDPAGPRAPLLLSEASCRLLTGLTNTSIQERKTTASKEPSPQMGDGERVIGTRL